MECDKPVLGYVLVGNNADSEMYVKFKKQVCDQLGIEYQGIHLTKESKQEEVNKAVA